MAAKDLNPVQTELVRLYLYEEFDNTTAPAMLESNLIYLERGCFWLTEKGTRQAEHLIQELLDKDRVIYSFKVLGFQISFRIRIARI